MFYDGALIYVDSVQIGGNHVTNDIARGLSTPLPQAERLKT
ncbi:MAG: cell division FtsA domain-containing protein, partial [Alphaproteobacteria bacterium]